MSKKYCYSEFEAAKKAKPKITYEGRYDRNSRYQERPRDWEESESDDFEATSYPQRLPPINIPERGCCPCKRNIPQPVEKSDSSSDLDSIQGYGFIDHYRSRGPNNRHDELEDDESSDLNTSELFNVDRYLTCLGPKKSVPKEDPAEWETYDGPSTSKGYRPRQETLPPFDQPSTSSGSSRTEPPQFIKPHFLPLTESYLRSIFRSASREEPRQCRQQMEENPGYSRRDKRFMRGNPPPRPSIKSPERVPCKNHYAPRSSSSRIAFRNPYASRSSARFSPRFHPRQMTRSESSNASSAVPQSSEIPAAETESEMSVEQPSESLEAEPESSHRSSYSSEGYSEYPSLGMRIVRESRKNLEMGIRCPRICGGCPCLRKPPEPRYKIATSSSRMHFRPCCGSPWTATKAKRSCFKWKTYLQPPVDGEDDKPMQSLLSPRSLTYTRSTCSVRGTPIQGSRHPEPRSSSGENIEAHSEESSHLTPPDLAEFSELPEVSSRCPSGPNPDCRCSQGERLPSLASRQTFKNVWRMEPQPMDCNESGGLYGQKDKLKYATIDRMDAGFSFTPLFEGSKAETRDRIRYFAIEFDRRSIQERMQDTELRFSQLRQVLAKADEACLRHFKKRKAAVWPMKPEGHQYVCPIGHTCCPPVTDETILSHKLLHYYGKKGIELREVFAGDRILFIINPRSYIIARNICISAIVYAGVHKVPSTLPGRRFMPIRNKQLPRIYARFSEHLPLFVMLCRLKRSAPDDRPRSRGCRVERDDVLFVWVTSVDLPCPVHVIMTVMNRRMDATRSTVIQVRPLHESQNVLDMMQSSCQYMRLGEQDLRVLTSGETEPLYLEVSVKEFSGTLECTPSPALTKK